MIITFCGHSQIFNGDEIKQKLSSVLEETVCGQDVEFLIGCYGDFDYIAASCARAYKSMHPNCKVVLVTPYIHTKLQNNRLKSARDYYDEIVYPPLENVPYKFAIIKCNQWMVDKSDLVIASVDCDWGGAFKTLDYACRKKKRFINLGKFEF